MSDRSKKGGARAAAGAPRLAVSEKPTNPKDVLAVARVPVDLCPDTQQSTTAMAFLEGALKYGRYNWRIKGVRASVYGAALRRHVFAWWNGEDVDPDSGLPHLWKASACIAILIDAGVCEKLTDDRPPRVAIGNFLKSMEPLVAALRAQHSGKDVKHYTIDDKPEILRVKKTKRRSPWTTRARRDMPSPSRRRKKKAAAAGPFRGYPRSG